MIILLAVGMLSGGLLTGGYNDVLSKAVVICMECIGIG